MLTTACRDQKNDTRKTTVNISSENHYDLPDSLSTRRIYFVLDLKQSVAESSWSDFGKNITEGTLVYFHGDRAEVFFPTPKVFKALENYEQYSDDYYVTTRADSIPYHMEVMISFDEEDASRFFYKNPVELYSSVEEIGKYIPSVESTEMWATMVLHEMFHHYQYNNENYREYAETEIGSLPFSIRDLVSLASEDEAFSAMIQQENDYLMQAISEDDIVVRDSLITTYLQQRQSRISEYSKEFPLLEKVENYYVIQEGSARYMEYKSMFILSDYAGKETPPVIVNDSLFKSYAEFQEIDLNDPAFSYLTYAAPSDYHYTIGFNIMRLLDALKVEYKSELLYHPEKGLHQYLEDYMNTL
ncbi:hypothetical protein D3A96_11270 [Robertkochia marina]|nr:hypothetical protein D3A96_11270 [Robertkochia marina]